jgi:hypothetical protein
MARVRTTESKPKSDAYTGLLALSLLAMITASVLLYFDFSAYDPKDLSKIKSDLKSNMKSKAEAPKELPAVTPAEPAKTDAPMGDAPMGDAPKADAPLPAPDAPKPDAPKPGM